MSKRISILNVVQLTLRGHATKVTFFLEKSKNRLYRPVFGTSREEFDVIRTKTVTAKRPWKKKLIKAYQETNDSFYISNLHALLSFPELLSDKVVGAKLFLSVLVAQVSDLVSTQLSSLPAIQLGHLSTVPNYLDALLNGFQGPPRWIGDNFILKRPWVLAQRVVNSAPSLSLYDYVGGEVESKGERLRFWIPYVCSAYAISSNVPDLVWRTIIDSSPLSVPLLCGQQPKRDRSLVFDLHLDGVGYNPGQLENFSSIVYRGFNYWVVSQFLVHLRKKSKKGKLSIDPTPYLTVENSGLYRHISTNEEERFYACSLSLLRHLLDFCISNAYLTESEADSYMSLYWSLVLPNSCPTSSVQAPIGQWKDSEVFFTFLKEYISSETVALPGELRSADTAIAIVDSLSPCSLVIPRTKSISAYAGWLDSHGLSSDEVRTRKETQVQKALGDHGILFKCEGNENSWRYFFYTKGHVPEGTKDLIPCFGIALSQLPLCIQDALRDKLGAETVSQWIRPSEIPSDVEIPPVEE